MSQPVIPGVCGDNEPYPFRLHAVGGLCNRLRAILSYRAFHGRIEVVWDPDNAVSGARWSDVFEPLEGVRFLSGAGSWDAEDCHVLASAPVDWVLAYRDLELQRDVNEAYYQARRRIPRGPAMHVRRTDFTADQVRFGWPEVTDEDFEAWAINVTHPGSPPVYLATDNGTTQRHLATRLYDRGRPVLTHCVLMPDPKEGEHSVRFTTLADTAIDLFLCAGATAFKGTPHSSFSDTVRLLRGLGGWW